MAIRAVTFDVYSALFDTVTSLARDVHDLFRRRGVRDDPRVVAGTWRQKMGEYLLLVNALGREAASTREAIEAAARYALRRIAPPLTAAEIGMLVKSWEHLAPWPEVPEVLPLVRERPLTLAALSNGDPDMLQILLRALPVPFDHIISTDGAPFKPHPCIYQKALDVLGVRADELLHVAGSATDSMGATAAGIRTVWVNRSGDAVLDPRLAPAHDVADLRGVLSIIQAVKAG